MQRKNTYDSSDDDSDTDIDIDDEEILQLQRRMHGTTNAAPQPKLQLKAINLQNYKPKHNLSCEQSINKYKKNGIEINAFLRGTYPHTPDFEKLVFKLDQCFQKVASLFPTTAGNYIKSFRTMSNKFDSNKTSGYTSTSNQFVGMSSKFLYTIYIPFDANVIVIDISKETNKSNAYEIVLERHVKLIDLGHNKFVVKTQFSNSNTALFTKL
jgi:hypothetical protein